MLLLYLFGPPTDKTERYNTTLISGDEWGGTVQKVDTYATWTYNLGPRHLVRIYELSAAALRAA